ncbi:hypothetical protein H5410_000589 [Solanum commersonii]|uniref:Uncharacterized protein n=1 Tax=Solanum commersonii TaxID=4109 RepID=A0A9J6AWL9_SOLCO|nr:hypothetical protein H5410_000589 [Solanum commersonii]
MLDAGIHTVPAHSFINSHSLTDQEGGHIFVKMHSKPGSKVCLSSLLMLDGIGPVRELDEKSKVASCVQLLLKDKNSSWPLKLLFLSENPLSFPNLKS